MLGCRLVVCALAAALVALCGADCPDDGCRFDAAQNTFPTIAASLENGVLTVQTTSYGGQYMFIGAVEEDADGTQGQDSCLPDSTDGEMSTSTDCDRTMTYTWAWDTITNPACSGSYVTGDNGEYIERSVRVQIVDREISGQSLHGDTCVEVYQMYTLSFRFPTTTYFNDTITGYSPIRFASALINELSHNLDTDTTHGDLFFTLSYPFKLAGDVSVNSAPVDAANVAITRIEESSACTEDNQSDCDYVFDLSILESVCNDDGVVPFGEYVFDFQITLRDGVDGPTGFETNYTLTFDIPELVNCDFNLYTGVATVSPFTAWTDPDTGAMTPTTQFLYQQPVTLVIPIAVDFYTPTAGNLNYLRVCEKPTQAAAENEACTSFEALAFDGSDYQATAGFSLLTDAVYGNVFHIEDSVDPTDPTLQVTFFFDNYEDVGDAATPHATAFLRLEVLVTDLRFSGDTKALDEVTVFPTVSAHTTLSIGLGGAPSRSNSDDQSGTTVVYKTDVTLTVVVSVGVAAVLVLGFVWSRRRSDSPGAGTSRVQDSDAKSLL